EEQRQMEEAKASTFVLITTEPEDVYSDAAILEEYKLQTAVETRFRNLKSRPNIVDNIYVKSLRRAEALAYVFLLALIVASYIEIKIRQESAVRQRPFLVPGNRWTQRPTMTRIFDVLSSVCILQIPSERGLRRCLPDDPDPRVYELLDLMGFDHRVCSRPPCAGRKSAPRGTPPQKRTSGLHRPGVRTGGRAGQPPRICRLEARRRRRAPEDMPIGHLDDPAGLPAPDRILGQRKVQRL